MTIKFVDIVGALFIAGILFTEEHQDIPDVIGHPRCIG
jgi:hypothetical protein